MKLNKYITFAGGWFIALVAFILWMHTVTDEITWVILIPLPVIGSTMVLGALCLRKFHMTDSVILSVLSATMLIFFVWLAWDLNLDGVSGIIPFGYAMLFLWPYSAILAIISLILLIQWALQVRKARIAAHDEKAGVDPVTAVNKQNKTAETGE